MPQTKAKKKFFSIKADKFFLKIVSENSQTPFLANFGQYKGFLKNITGGEA